VGERETEDGQVKGEERRASPTKIFHRKPELPVDQRPVFLKKGMPARPASNRAGRGRPGQAGLVEKTYCLFVVALYLRVIRNTVSFDAF